MKCTTRCFTSREHLAQNFALSSSKPVEKSGFVSARCRRRSIFAARDRSRDTHSHRNGETPKADQSVKKGGDRAARCEARNAAEHPMKGRASARASLSVRPREQIDGIERRLCRVARHERRRRKVTQVELLGGILRGHSRDPGKSRHQRSRRITVREWTERHGEDEEQQKKEHLGGEQDSQCWQSTRGQLCTRKSRNRDHANEFWERYELGYDSPWCRRPRPRQG
jgi:hypothetical protein